VPLDDATLAVLSVGVPIGLGIYLAWVDRNRRKRFGLAWAMVGALAGAVLGFQAGTGLLALITTIIGATLGANLLVLALDIWGARVVEAEKAPALETRPSTV
jgi:hypothetical protein